MSRTLLPKERAAAFSCGLAGKYIDDKNAQQKSWDSQKGLRVCFVLEKCFRSILYTAPRYMVCWEYGNKDLTSPVADDKPHWPLAGAVMGF